MAKKATLFVVLFCVVIGFSTAIAAQDNTERKPIKLTFANYWTGARISVMDAQLQKFQELYPWITVENQVTSTAQANMSKTYVAIAAGTPPDVWMIQRSSMPSFVEQKFLQPIDKYIQEDNLNMNIFYKSEQETSKYQGKTYAMPILTGSLSLLYYNRMLMSQGGYSANQPPKTWDELRSMASRLQRVRPDGTLEIGGGNLEYLSGYKLAGVSYTFGADVIRGPFELNYLTDRVREAANWVADFASRIPRGGAMAKNTLVFMTHGEWQYFTLKEANPDLDLGIALIPHGPYGESVNLFGGAWAYGIPTGVKHPYESWLLIKFLTTSTEARDFTFEQGRPSPVIKFTQDRRYFEQNPYWSVIGEALNRMVTYPPSPLTQTMANIDVAAYAKLFTGQESSEAILTTLQNDINQAIAKYKAAQ